MKESAKRETGETGETGETRVVTMCYYVSYENLYK